MDSLLLQVGQVGDVLRALGQNPTEDDIVAMVMKVGPSSDSRFAKYVQRTWQPRRAMHTWEVTSGNKQQKIPQNSHLNGV